MIVSINDYRVVDDPHLVDIPWKIPAEIRGESDKLYYLCQEGKANTKERIERIIGLYPNIPNFRNYLIAWYQVNGRFKEASRLNDEVIKLFPDYIFAVSQKVQDLVKDGMIDEARELLRGNIDIDVCYPSRKSFHITEFSAFYQGVVYYLCAAYRFDEAQEKIDLLEKAGVRMDTLDRLHSVKMRYMFERASKWRKECEAKEIKAIKRKEMTVPQKELEMTPKDVQFQFLYADTLWDIDAGLLKNSIENNKEALIAELNHVLTIAVEGFEHIEEQADTTEAALHALLILSYIDDEASFPAALQLLRQPDSCYEYWIGDYGDNVMNEFFRNYSPGKLQQTLDFMLESPGNTHSKNLLISLLPKFAAHTPEVRDTLLNTIKTIFAYFTVNRDNKELFDTDVLAFTVGAAVDLRATELIDDIEQLYAHDYVSLMVEGKFEEVKNRIITGEEIRTPNFYDDLYSHLDSLRKKRERTTKPKEIDSPQKTEPSIPKVSRNSPCPCGSGKKYKRCHGKNS